MNILQRLQSNNFAIYLSMAACVILCPNMIYVFYNVGAEMPFMYLREIFSVSAALLLCGLILYFTAKKDLDMAARFAWFEMFISMCYYTIRLVINPLNAGESINWYIIPAIALAYILPWSVKQVAKTIEMEDSDEVKQLKATNELLSTSLIESNNTLEKATEMLHKKNNEVLEILEQLSQYEKGIHKIIPIKQPDVEFPEVELQVKKTEEIQSTNRIKEVLLDAKESLQVKDNLTINIEKKPVEPVQRRRDEESIWASDNQPESQI